MATAKTLFSDQKRHDSFWIMEGKESISFILSSCFDYNLGEWDCGSVQISKKDFIQGIKEFLETGVCQVNNFEMRRNQEGIYIFVGKSFDVFTSHWTTIEWTISSDIKIKNFLKMLRKKVRKMEN